MALAYIILGVLHCKYCDFLKWGMIEFHHRGLSLLSHAKSIERTVYYLPVALYFVFASSLFVYRVELQWLEVS